MITLAIRRFQPIPGSLVFSLSKGCSERPPPKVNRGFGGLNSLRLLLGSPEMGASLENAIRWVMLRGSKTPTEVGSRSITVLPVQIVNCIASPIAVLPSFDGMSAMKQTTKQPWIFKFAGEWRPDVIWILILLIGAEHKKDLLCYGTHIIV
jgi:hypothetical protein